MPPETERESQMQCTRRKTKAINLRIEEQFEQLLRDSVGGIRKGGPEFRRSLQTLIDDLKMDTALPRASVQEKLEALERRIQALEGQAPPQ